MGDLTVITYEDVTRLGHALIDFGGARNPGKDGGLGDFLRMHSQFVEGVAHAFGVDRSGRKRWLLYGDSVDTIDRRTLSSASVPPAGAIFDEILHPGDLSFPVPVFSPPRA